VAITYFLGSLGAVLGPLFGVIMADYYLNRRGRLSVPDLYSDRPGSPYFFRGGWNPRAVAAFVPAALISAALALVPALSAASAYGWFVGVGVAALLYWLITPRPTSGPAAEPLVGALATD
jgi:NCS1 family nucleobase:cation symporter-1